MAFEITAGSPQLSIDDGCSVLIRGPDAPCAVNPATLMASIGATPGC